MLFILHLICVCNVVCIASSFFAELSCDVVVSCGFVCFFSVFCVIFVINGGLDIIYCVSLQS